MYIKNNSFIFVLSIILFGTTLISCGGSGGTTLNSITIDANNYETVLRKSVISSSDLLEDLMGLGYLENDVDPSILDLIQTNGNVSTYRCSNQEGTLKLVQIDTNTIEFVFNNCDFPRTFSLTHHKQITRYNNKVRVQNISSSGNVDEAPNTNFSWNLIQKATLTNLTLSSVISDGNRSRQQANETIIYNGEAILSQSNDTTSLLLQNIITSSNLKIDKSDSSGNHVTYNYSQLLYEIFSNYNNDDTNIDYDFIADITDIGNTQLTTEPILKFQLNIGFLNNGSAILTTGKSTVKIDAIGSNEVEVSIKQRSDGVFDTPISSSWNTLRGCTPRPLYRDQKTGLIIYEQCID